MNLTATKNPLILFQGDSITDAGRNREEPWSLGTGYALMIAGWVKALFPEINGAFLNRGVSGDRVVDLKARWQEDCLDLKPDLVSIMIGINDCWRRYDSNMPLPVEEFEANYRAILKQTKERLDAEIVLCEPFLLPVQEGQEMWYEDLGPKIQVVRKLAREYNTVFIPYDGIFAQAASVQKPAYWLQDGVHPTEAGHALIAREWMKQVFKLGHL
ncbi:MAG TPA: SGNH/GDSL hydrolase family protein [Firmicutes bacterium]|jgi:acyl-CoA thioesterase-1|nr:SGNH/GDSL hydrolase family protein [Bacillota bacterium]